MDKKTKKSPSLPPSPQKAQKKKLSTLSLLIGCMKFLFPKQLVNFQPGQIIGWGYTLWRLIALKPSFEI
jgi:hypothetical protein